jgi:hypothetical protein
MHSFTDCAMGVVMGVGIWWVHDGYWGLVAGALVEEIVERSRVHVQYKSVMIEYACP